MVTERGRRGPGGDGGRSGKGGGWEPVRSLPELITLLPFVLGYVPRESLVVVALHPRGSRGRESRTLLPTFFARVDLPPPGLATVTTASLLPALRRDGAPAAGLIAFERWRGQGEAALDDLARACSSEGTEVLGQVCVHHGRWYDPASLAGTGPSPVPASGRPLPRPEEVPAVARMVLQGKAPAGCREDLGRRLQPDDPEEAGAVSRAAARLVVQGHGTAGTDCAGSRATALDVWGRILEDGPDGLSVDDIALAAVSLRDLALRDGILTHLCPGHLDPVALDPALRTAMRRCLPAVVAPGGPAGPLGQAGDERGALLGRLVRLCGRIPSEWSTPALTVLAVVAWENGDGALTRVALDQALAQDPEYRLARLLLQLVDHMIRLGPEPA